jgi:hypothetical protein
MSRDESFVEKLQRQSRKKVVEVERRTRETKRVAKVCKHFASIA